MPAISVIIPVYNVENYLEDCLDSIMNQTFKDFECICIDDGSTDKSPEILEKYARRDSRIIIIRQQNKGCSAARNAGMDKAAGNYITFIDSDDFVHDRYLEILSTAVLKTGADIAVSEIIKYKKGQKRIFRHFNPEEIKYQLLCRPLYNIQKRGRRHRIRFQACARLYKTELIKKHRFIDGICYEDYPWTICLMSENPKVVLLNEPLYFYRYNPVSITKSSLTAKKICDYQQGLQFTYEYFRKNSKDMGFLRKRLLPVILKTQLELIESHDHNPEIIAAFAKQLSWAREINLLSFWHNSWLRLWKYYKIMRSVLVI